MYIMVSTCYGSAPQIIFPMKSHAELRLQTWFVAALVPGSYSILVQFSRFQGVERDVYIMLSDSTCWFVAFLLFCCCLIEYIGFMRRFLRGLGIYRFWPFTGIAAGWQAHGCATVGPP